MKKWVAGIASGVILLVAGTIALGVAINKFFERPEGFSISLIVGWGLGVIVFVIGYGVYTWVENREYDKRLRETMKEVDRIRDER